MFCIHLARCSDGFATRISRALCPFRSALSFSPRSSAHTSNEISKPLSTWSHRILASAEVTVKRGYWKSAFYILDKPSRVHFSTSRRASSWGPNVRQPGDSTEKENFSEQVRYVLDQKEEMSLLEYLGNVSSVNTVTAGKEIIPSKPNASGLGFAISEEAGEFEPTDDESASILYDLELLLNNEDSSHLEIWEQYSLLKYPRTSQIPRPVLNLLLERLMQVEPSQKNEKNMRRFLSLIDDVKSVGRPLLIAHWNTAIHFAGRCYRKVLNSNVENAMDIWRELEDGQETLKADATTFNILFDITTKAQKYILADMIRGEMKKRGIAQDRYFWTTLILSHGARGDGDKVREAYTDMVNANEIVDTAVINSVIKALLLCGEASAAEQTFERQKRLHASKTDAPLPPTDWRLKRRLARDQKRYAESRRCQEIEKQAADTAKGPFSSNPTPVPEEEDTRPGNLTPQDTKIGNSENNAEVKDVAEKEMHVAEEETRNLNRLTCVAPDINTYSILVLHHAIYTGDIDRAAVLVEEMEQYKIDLHGSVYISLFRGFGVHGGLPYSQWNIARLQNVYLSYLEALDSENDQKRVFLTGVAARIIATAFHKCYHPQKAADIWLELRPRLEVQLDQPSDIQDLENQIAADRGEDEPAFWELIEYRIQEREQAQEARGPDGESAKTMDLENMEDGKKERQI